MVLDLDVDVGPTMTQLAAATQARPNGELGAVNELMMVGDRSFDRLCDRETIVKSGNNRKHFLVI